MSPSAQASSRPAGAAGAATKVAGSIRSQIVEGSLTPGVRLPEERVRAELGVSRSSLREGFQLLIRERLLVHQLSRGFFVRELSRGDISDLYAVRRVMECGALREVVTLQPQQLRDLTQPIVEGRAAADEGNWHAVAAASIRFHEQLVALAGSARLNTLMSQVLAEFRLSYAYMSDPMSFHAPFLERHQELAERIRSGEVDQAVQLLESYLRDAEAALLQRYSEIEGQTKQRRRA
ncbi:GntR family transcriptional regulator [Aeromicrobium sp. CTD01-1L150]|uniref:GntR family transcriptional regulator n=1 Tax=Aeromicrobium sp. CTD01-1L150 TaxID=3341830 RepID=UPI0035C0EC8A